MIVGTTASRDRRRPAVNQEPEEPFHGRSQEGLSRRRGEREGGRRKRDGEDLADKVGNAGDEIRKDLGNLGDDAREAGHDAERKIDDATDDARAADPGRAADPSPSPGCL